MPLQTGTDGAPPTDLLLLNASNLERNKIYPYAFVQLRALARARGLSMSTYDMLGVHPDGYRDVVARLVARHRPRMIGLTLRQADSVFHEEYARPGWKPYFPVDDTAALIAAVRQESGAPVVVGGFGFTTHARRLFDRLRPDFGVEGEPDGFFDRFDDVAAGRALPAVDNLLFREGGELRRNARVYHAPFGDREYDEAVLADMEAFYGRDHLYGPTPPTVAVELARGCIFRCEFCTEPWVKGRKVRPRDLDAVMGDVEFLALRGIRRIMLICSEINMGSPDLALEVAGRFRRLNERLGARRVHWQAYHLPRWLSRDELGELYASGFAGGWNDFPSFHDRNLVQLRVPYRTHHVLGHVRNVMELQGDLPYDQKSTLGVFLGNRYSGPETVAHSIRAFHDAGLLPHVGQANIGLGTRLFAPDGATMPAEVNAVTYTRAGVADEVDVAQPTFYLAPALEAALGGAERQHAFFAYVTSTLLSSQHVASRDWARFLANSAPAEWIARQLAPHRARLPRWPGASPAEAEAAARIAACGTGAALRDFLLDPTHDPEVRGRVSVYLVALLSRPVPPRYLAVLDYLELPHDAAGTVPASPYHVVVALLRRYDSVPDLLEDVERALDLPPHSREIWLLRRLLFEKNVVLKPEYRPLLLPPEADALPALTVEADAAPALVAPVAAGG